MMVHYSKVVVFLQTEREMLNCRWRVLEMEPLDVTATFSANPSEGIAQAQSLEVLGDSRKYCFTTSLLQCTVVPLIACKLEDYISSIVPVKASSWYCWTVDLARARVTFLDQDSAKISS